LLDSVDGLVLSGGGDVGPVCYGAPLTRASTVCRKERDVFEIALARAALARDDRPFLCICAATGFERGRSAAISIRISRSRDQHGRAPSARAAAYGITTRRSRPTSRLAALLGSTVVKVCSWHHQAIRTLAPGLRAVAWAEDGIIEASSTSATSARSRSSGIPRCRRTIPRSVGCSSEFVDLCR